MATTFEVSHRQLAGQGYAIETARATGESGAIAETYTAVATMVKLVAAFLHLNTAGTTNEDFEINKDSGSDNKHDTNLHTQDLLLGNVTDLVIPFEGIWLEAGDEIDVAWPNSEARDYGLELIFEVYN